MKKVTLLLAMILLVAIGYSQNKSNIKYVRKNASSPEGKADLEAMSVAFKKMREMSCDNGLSWYYQGAIHNIPNTIIGKNQLCAQYQNIINKLWAWGDCTHTNSENSKLHFLLWHRMYIWHLEKIVRELSGKVSFALPYWNYGENNVMPEELRTPQSSLYENARQDILNEGKPIQQADVINLLKSINKLKNIPSFAGGAGFSAALEGSPHNFMHGYIGRGQHYNEIYQKQTDGLMGLVPSAGFDPVFWLHHSMVDRIWESWDVSPYGQRPTLAELEKYPWKYEFIEPNGQKVTYTVQQMYDIVYNLDYKYDNLLYTDDDEQLASNENIKMNKTSFQEPKKTLVWEQKINKTLGETTFIHKIENKLSKNTSKMFKSEANSNMVLNLDIVLYKEPVDYYTVYLRYSGEEDKYVGMMTFFGVTHNHGTGDNHTISEEGVKLNYSYYVSDVLLSTDKPFEVIIKKNGSGDVQVTLEKISMVKIN
ncbi:tyrosinase family protein [Flavobacterium sp. F372]|uniref:Tyrosinase family protein n=1 Tax=Flavobacterium bernardetii TaxID=2813823 RepID=A0ABR7J057_9FLAO|nr:tyrosinase family protein [Flavobacterium bernardetii]MBC5835387.1 tyrosinase family protein [Flavobacterium bernardetii]NHF69731.1 tyrosinase family protein [Flavobacterium bernardetii]